MLDELRAIRRARETALAESSNPPAGPSIAVLPFTDMSPQKDQDYFCEGIAEEILHALTKVEGLHVVARTSAFQFKGKAEDIRRIGDALGVTSVLEGSVRTAGTRLRVTAQLISMADGYHLWSDRYDRQMDDVFAIQDEIAGSIIETLREKLVGAPAIVRAERRPDNLDAYHLYLKGRHHWYQRHEEGLDQARRCFEQAIELDPSYARAHAGLAETHCILGLYGIVPPRVAFATARRAVERALTTDAGLADAHAALGLIGHWFDWDWAGAEHAFRRALELDPAHTQAHCWLAFLLATVQARFADALAETAKAEASDPLSPYVLSITGVVHFYARRFDDAIAMIHRGLERGLSPTGMLVLGMAQLASARYGEAISTWEELAATWNRLPLSIGYLGAAYARAGRTDDAQAVARELRERAARKPISPLAMVAPSLGLGDTEAAFGWLEHAYNDRSGFLFTVGVDPLYDPLRGDPRFDDLLRRMKLTGS